MQKQMILLEQNLFNFSPISLEALKNKAELMARRDNKYVLSTDEILELLQHASSHFDILEIDGVRQFNYLSHYYDCPDLTTYFDHNKGRRRRIKIRHRHYVDSDRHFFEIKIKGLRDFTNKFRILFNPECLKLNGLNRELSSYYLTTIKKSYGPDYGADWLNKLIPSISVGYRRITLVSKKGHDRITIDSDIHFIDKKLGKEASLDKRKWVVEVKSLSGKTSIDSWLFRNKKRPVSLCSKYGMGVNLLRFPDINNRFSKILRRHFANHSNN